MIMNKGVKKSNNEVTKGIKKLLGSLPCLNKKTELTNKRINIKIKRSKIVIKIIEVINRGFTI